MQTGTDAACLFEWVDAWAAGDGTATAAAAAAAAAGPAYPAQNTAAAAGAAGAGAGPASPAQETAAAADGGGAAAAAGPASLAQIPAAAVAPLLLQLSQEAQSFGGFAWVVIAPRNYPQWLLCLGAMESTSPQTLPPVPCCCCCCYCSWNL